MYNMVPVIQIWEFLNWIKAPSALNFQNDETAKVQMMRCHRKTYHHYTHAACFINCHIWSLQFADCSSFWHWPDVDILHAHAVQRYTNLRCMTTKTLGSHASCSQSSTDNRGHASAYTHVVLRDWAILIWHACCIKLVECSGHDHAEHPSSLLMGNSK